MSKVSVRTQRKVSFFKMWLNACFCFFTCHFVIFSFSWGQTEMFFLSSDCIYFLYFRQIGAFVNRSIVFLACPTRVSCRRHNQNKTSCSRFHGMGWSTCGPVCENLSQEKSQKCIEKCIENALQHFSTRWKRFPMRCNNIQMHWQCFLMHWQRSTTGWNLVERGIANFRDHFHCHAIKNKSKTII